jgi:stearoyl-CoA desaturase (delta-9 desaturase)
MSYPFRGTSENSQRVIMAQVVLGVLSGLYFLFTAQYAFILYAFLFFFVVNHFFHNVALHRYFSHNAFKTNKFWHIFMAMLSPIASAGSAYGYAMAHRTHHKYSDTEKDPTNLDLGLLRVAFFKWNLDHVPMGAMRSLSEDKWIMLSHNYYVLIILGFWFTLMLFGFEWAMMYNLAAFFMFLEYCVINIVNHSGMPFSYRNHDTKDHTTNDLFTGLFCGDWHNNHHHRAGNWNQREKWWEFDIPAQMIKLIRTRSVEKS